MHKVLILQLSLKEICFQAQVNRKAFLVVLVENEALQAIHCSLVTLPLFFNVVKAWSLIEVSLRPAHGLHCGA